MILTACVRRRSTLMLAARPEDRSALRRARAHQLHFRRTAGSRCRVRTGVVARTAFFVGEALS
jgi:hypothetical protein